MSNCFAGLSLSTENQRKSMPGGSSKVRLAIRLMCGHSLKMYGVVCSNCLSHRAPSLLQSSVLRLLLVTSVLGTVTGALGQTTVSSVAAPTTSLSIAPAPKIQFAETTYDFGRVDSGEAVTHDFVFTNIGTATLEITGVRPGCGCTTAGDWDRRVEPGRTGIIPLQFNSGAFSGKVSKPATVTCNDPGQSIVVIYITGTIWKPFEVTPPMAVFNVSSEAKDSEVRVVHIVNNSDEPITLSDLYCARPFQANLKTVEPGKEFSLEITATPPFTTNSTAVPITLKTSSPKMAEIKVSAYVVIKQPVVVAPSQILLPAGPLTDPVRSVVMIRDDGTNSLVLSDADVNIAGADVSVAETVRGRMFNLTVNFPAGLEIRPDQKAEVTVKSNHPGFPLIRVPVRQARSQPSVVSSPRQPSVHSVVPNRRVLPTGG